MRTLILTWEEFNEMLSGLIQSGVTFEAERDNNDVKVTFTGGY